MSFISDDFLSFYFVLLILLILIWKISVFIYIFQLMNILSCFIWFFYLDFLPVFFSFILFSPLKFLKEQGRRENGRAPVKIVRFLHTLSIPGPIILLSPPLYGPLKGDWRMSSQKPIHQSLLHTTKFFNFTRILPENFLYLNF